MPRYSVKTMKAGQRRWTDTGYHDPVTGYVRWDSLCMVRMFSEQESVQVLEQEGCKKKQGNEYDKGPEGSSEGDLQRYGPLREVLPVFAVHDEERHSGRNGREDDGLPEKDTHYHNAPGTPSPMIQLKPISDVHT